MINSPIRLGFLVPYHMEREIREEIGKDRKKDGEKKER